MKSSRQRKGAKKAQKKEARKGRIVNGSAVFSGTSTVFANLSVTRPSDHDLFTVSHHGSPGETDVSDREAPAHGGSFNKLLFLASLTTDRSRRETLQGDIQERFEKECELFGERWARYLMIRDIFMAYWSAFESFPGKILRALLKYLGLGGVVR